MKRDLRRLSSESFDVLVVGGGISGAFIAWDAALRGLSVSLVERGDFGHATSANSLKIIHGGLRYLQTGDLRRMRASIVERSAFLRIAPHLVYPYPFLMPTYGHGIRGREALRAALAINDLVGADRNRGLPQTCRLPASRVVSAEDCRALVPGLSRQHLTGGALWYDGVSRDSERLVLSVIQSAVEAGAVVANYARVESFVEARGRVSGARVTDALGTDSLEVQARVVVSAAGPWNDAIVGTARRWAKAMNLVVPPIGLDRAVGLSSSHDGKGRLYFFLPWRACTLVGTAYFPVEPGTDAVRPVEKEIETFVADVNRAYPPLALHAADVRYVHAGLVPVKGDGSGPVDRSLADRYEIVDHGLRGGLEGLLSIVPVKYTEARLVAEKTVDRVFEKLGKPPPRSRTTETPLAGADAGPPGMTNSIPETAIIHALRHEMAETLADVVLRRAPLAALGHPGRALLERAAALAAAERGWDPPRVARELDEIERLLGAARGAAGYTEEAPS